MNRLTIFDVTSIEWKKARRIRCVGREGYFACIDLEVGDANNALTEVELHLADEAALEKLAASLGVEVTRDAREGSE